MRIQLSDHFTYRRLLRFVLPSVCMMLFTSMYGMVDGFFISNYVGKTAFAAVNLVIPYSMAISVFGFMLGTGGSALVSKTLGEGKQEQAEKYFSMFVYIAMGTGIVLGSLSIIFMPQLASLLGADASMYDYCVVYGRVMMISTPGFILQVMFQSFFVAAEKPQLSFWITLIAGMSNIILDWLLIGILGMGVVGAAAATVIGELIGGLTPLVYFFRKNNSLLRLRRCGFYGKAFLHACGNGLSEMVTNLSVSVVNIVYNHQLMKLVGGDGVSAYGIIMYVNFAFMAVLLGYAIGSAPIVSYHYGAGNHGELKNLYRKGLSLMLISGVVLMLAAELLAKPLVTLYAGYDAELCQMTIRGFRIYSIAFLVMGVNVWASAFFTALNNGFISALISLTRTFVIQIVMVLILPIFFGLTGVWCSITVAEVCSLLMSVGLLLKYGKAYHYR